VVLGLAILFLGPFLAATLTTATSHPASARLAPTPRVSQPPDQTAAVEVSAEHHLRPERIVTPAPTPAPAPPAVKPPVVVHAKPAPKPAPPVVSYPPGSIEAIITAAAQRHGVDPAWMIRTASCESGLRPNAYNPAGPYIGLFQFLPSTFRAHGGTNIYDPVQQSEIAASMFAAGNSNAWPVCSHR
jgi:soluble lytic murein transglycosylase-like protein